MSGQSLGEKMAALEVYKQNLQTLAQQEQYIRSALESYLTARETIRSYSETKEGEEVLVPVGGNAFVVAQSKDGNRVLRNVGNDIVVEEDSASAIKNMTAQIEEMGDTLQNLSGRIVDLERKLQKLSAEVEQEYQATGGEGAPQG